MPSFDIDVQELRGSWVVKLNGRVVSGAATRPKAERIASCAADSLRTSGFDVQLDLACQPERLAA